MWYQLLCSFAVLVSVRGAVVSKVVNTAQGPVRGFKANNRDVFDFYNIPYATAPTGINKFKAPLPPPTWTEIFDAVDKEIICPQNKYHHLNQTEDCLVINVHIPNTQESNLPVMVLVHGGGYAEGYGNLELSQNPLVERGQIVAVSFNYRLGTHGFLCLGTDTAPGNAGMKDQLAALRWVNDNIRSFGGNPNDVTIVGCSAGGSSVDLLVLSNTTDGLFHKVITESGCSLAFWGLAADPVDAAFVQAASLNLTVPSDLNALGELFATLPMETLKIMSSVPCVERDIGQEVFLVEAPFNILKNGNYKKLPTIYGYANMEFFPIHILLPLVRPLMNLAFHAFLPYEIKFESEQQRVSAGIAAREFYFGGQVKTTDALPMIYYFGDTFFKIAILRALQMQVTAGNNQVYLYEYSFADNASQPVPGTGERGAVHCEQIMAAFGTNLGENPSDKRVEMSKLMGELYLNFIITGNPTPAGVNSTLPTWLPVQGPDRSPHYSIGSTNIQLAGIPIEDRIGFWDRIFFENDVVIPEPPQQPENDTETTDETTSDITSTEFTTTESPTTEPNAATSFKNKFWIAHALVILLAFR